jgi:hypothetical protein
MHIAILLSCHNGETYLPEFLRSLVAQSHVDWRLHWRDDGSSDSTTAIMQAFAAGAGSGRCLEVSSGEGRLGVTGSFMALLRSVTHGDGSDPGEGGDLVAFADQDDVWLPEKLARGVAALVDQPAGRPALYFARQILVDRRLMRLAVSPPTTRKPGFLTALTGNTATGCTVMMNRAAARLVAISRFPPCAVHDWWSYLLVAAAGGAIIADPQPTVLYRQHASNAIGAPRSMWRRGLCALRRGPGAFMTLFRSHVAALRAQPEQLTAETRAQLDILDRALASGMRERLQCLRMKQLRRQTWYETAVFACWLALG